MKKFLSILLILFTVNSFAATVVYKVASSGNDANNGITAPWKTLAKVNAMQSSFNAGDMVLFNRGDVFYGNLVINKSGSSGDPIIYGAYGVGANPVITGFTTVSSWTNTTTGNSNIWESTTPVSTLSTCNIITIGGVNYAMGRTPNTGYSTYQSASGTSQLTSNTLNSAVTNWTGAQVVVRKYNYVTDRCLITSQSGSTLNFTSTDGYNCQPGFGFYIENDVRTLDVQNEWYYNPSTKKIRIYSTSAPTNVQVSTIDTLVTIIGLRSYVTFDGLTFSGSNKDAFTIRSAQNITIQNCTIDYSGQDAIWGGQNGGAASTNFVFQNNLVNHTNNNAIILESEFAGASINGNQFLNTGMNDGMGGDGSGNNGTLYCIQAYAAGIEVKNNTVKNVGYNGISFRTSNVLVHDNYVDSTCIVKQDGAGIYSYVGNGSRPYSGQKVYNNIVLNTLGSNAGTNNTGAPVGHGIYMDDGVANVEIYGNTSANNGYSGLYLHNNYNINVHNNTFYNNGAYQLLAVSFEDTYPNRLLNIVSNKFISKTAAQKCASFETKIEDIKSFGTFDSNYYARPIDDNLTIQVVIDGNYGSPSQDNLAMWKTYSGQDANSKKSPIAITNVNQFFTAYNPTDHDSTIILPSGTWIDIANVTYNTGSTVLHSYSSVVLLNTGTNVAPIADAGTNKNITLPTETITQVGSGSDADGTIASYLWTQVSGAATATIVSPNSATTVINGLSVAGNYVFRLTVTDNFGLTGTDTMSVVVNSSPPVNIPPTANAGGNKNITLPTSTVTQVGSGTDPDGSIVGYAWTQGSNPTAATIVSPTNSTTVINGMTVAGTYSFTLTVTDNDGATGSQTITVIVNTAAPIAPVANAGNDTTITWPANIVSLHGSGSDADGVIVAYNWSKVSGANATIASPNSANTNITLSQNGVYVFQLKVTDNSGLTGTDNLTVTVNKGTATLSFSNTTQTWTGLPLAPTVTTNPAGLSYALTYDGVSATPIEPKTSYSLLGNITDGNYNSSPVSGNFTINKATATFTITNTSQYYNGNPLIPFVTTNPANLTGVNIASPHTNPTIWSDTITLNNAHYQANQVVIPFTISTAGANIKITGYQNVFYTGSPIAVTVITNPQGLSNVVTYNGSTTPVTNASTVQVIATINDGIHTGADTVTMVIQKAATDNTLSWAAIPNAQEGTVLNSSQLNATSTIAGTFTYDLPIGYLLSAGVYRITGTFHPTDSANYNTSTIQNVLIVYGSPFLQYIIIHGKPYPVDYPQ